MIMNNNASKEFEQVRFNATAWFCLLVLIVLITMAPHFSLTAWADEDGGKTELTTIQPSVMFTASPLAAQSDMHAQETVYISRTGSKYHYSSSCSNMRNPSAVEISDAISRGYAPCSKCVGSGGGGSSSGYSDPEPEPDPEPYVEPEEEEDPSIVSAVTWSRLYGEEARDTMSSIVLK